MYCPKCGTERTSDETSFCSKCGFRLREVAELVGQPFNGDEPVDEWSPRKRGLFQSFLILSLGVILFASAFLLFGFVLLRNYTSYFVLASLVLFILGILRAGFAFFESSQVKQGTNRKTLATTNERPYLSEGMPPPAARVMDASRDLPRTTRELATPLVTEETTRSLSIESNDQ